MPSYRGAIGLVSAVLLSAPLLSGVLTGGSHSETSTTAGAPATTDAAPAALPALQVLSIGDSIMNGHGLPAGQAWPYLVAANDGWALTNDACDGVGVIAMGDPAKCNSTYTGVIASAAASTPDIVIFEGSSNDFGQDDAQLLAGTLADLRAIRSEFPSAVIVGLSTLWGYTAPPAQLADVNSQVQAAVTDVGGMYFDIGQSMAGHPELMQADDVHPNTAGQGVLATTIESALQPAVTAARQNQLDEALQLVRVEHLIATGVLE
jgi:acyl-CoA thioesterase-1